jgi:hypothetical protein
MNWLYNDNPGFTTVALSTQNPTEGALRTFVPWRLCGKELLTAKTPGPQGYAKYILESSPLPGEMPKAEG